MTQIMGRKRSKPRDLTDPRGQLGAYVEAWIDKNHGGDKSRLADALGLSVRTIGKWCEGEHAPDLPGLNDHAKAMGFADWGKLGNAVTKFTIA
jgi:transcriptional regulator with XRE-family HTH domain